MTVSPKISVIVPIYGVEKYLCQCVDSILAQTLTDIEIILVDDGSKDRCPEIVDEYAKKDSRIVAVHQENGGYGRAVNHGIELAKGEYIGIVEPDDWIFPNMYETLYADAKKYDVDVVKGTYNEFFDCESGEGYIQISSETENIQPLENPFTIYDYSVPLLNHASIWTGIYRLSFIKKNKIRVLEKNKGRYADQNWRYETLILADKIYWEDKPFYNYRLTNENASSFKKNNPDDVFDVYSSLDSFFVRYPERYKQVQDVYYYGLFRHLFWNLNRVESKYRLYLFKRMHIVFRKMDKSVVLKSNLFSPKEKITFQRLYRKTYLLEILSKSAVEWCFSMKNSDCRQYKVIKLFGVSFRFKKKKKNLKIKSV
ncbi:MAG: glycosyltransferase [Alphaproteobacteria bacterium]|nr:glycosyltransferase [Alphaproteobacteria bacterium]